MIEVIFYILVLATAFPVAWLLAWLCDDELVSDKKWFKYTLYCLGIVLLVILIFYRNLAIILSLVYMIIILLMLLWFGKNTKWIK